MIMDDMQKKSLDDFNEVLESMSKEELNNLIDEISNMETGGEPTISEYFSNGNNFLIVEDNSITIWGIDIDSFKVERTEVINRYILENEFPINKVCEILEGDTVGLYDLCVKIRSMY